ncbi:Transcriptional regulator of ribosomal biogenesis proteins [Malassezia equina]|uniref:Transcriptional regulator of ribosomal biogenesis proteins n=1 Tax=Malassezia equina TaxID=1381935 RepID=A0AAF0IX69_9BASI|nr:Transcriptional regulator of ribosomal biogenesis proteins [Malassezia equina]
MSSTTPGPIPIVRAGDNGQSNASEGTPLARQSGPGSYLGLSASLGGGSFKEAMALSFGKDVADFLEYSLGRFSSSTDSDATTIATPSSVRLESTFCRNFSCCGRALDDLHDLLQHYEECHVRFEDDEIASMVTDEELETSSLASDGDVAGEISSAASTKSLDSMEEESALKRGRSMTKAGTPMVSTADENLEFPSAFETAVMRSPSGARGKKRTFGQHASSSSANPLFRALVENGGRHPLGMSNAYSSPFSSPGNSRAGTPSLDSENEAFFGSTTQASIFSSLSIRPSAAEEQLPSCAPPNLFFPSAAASQRPSKRERFNVAAGGAPGNTPASPASSTASVSSAADNTAEHRPYKCPAPGCDKAYKQMNGLKYHRLHGHCNQNLRNVNGVSAGASSDPSQAANKPATPEKGASSTGDTKPDASSLGSAFLLFNTDDAANKSQKGLDTPSKPNNNVPPEKMYVCQVGNCDKRYKNLNGLRYHYLHSGSHGLLGLQLLHANGGGASAKADSVSGRPPVSTDTLSREQIVQAATAAQALLNQQNGTNCIKNQGTTNPNLSAAAFLASISNGPVSMTNSAKPA